jgi:hypothetical protein
MKILYLSRAREVSVPEEVSGLNRGERAMRGERQHAQPIEIGGGAFMFFVSIIGTFSHSRALLASTISD